MNRIIEEIREAEAEKRESALEVDGARISELEINIEQLKASILEKEEEFNSNRDTTREAIEAVENYKKIEVSSKLGKAKKNEPTICIEKYFF